jgi:hypothetical protein
VQRPARVQPPADGDDDLDDPDDDVDGMADVADGPEAFARVGPQPLRDTQIWQLDEAAQDAGWPA